MSLLWAQNWHRLKEAVRVAAAAAAKAVACHCRHCHRDELCRTRPVVIAFIYIIYVQLVSASFLWADYLENVGASTSHSLTGLHRSTFTFTFTLLPNFTPQSLISRSY
jgi:hypothetical protein